MTRSRDTSAVTPTFDQAQWDDLTKDINSRAALWKKGEGANFVPDDWATSAGALQGVSEDALGYLARNLRTKGRLSLQHALFFVSLVDKEQADVRANASIAATIRKTTSVRKAAEVEHREFEETV